MCILNRRKTAVDYCTLFYITTSFIRTMRLVLVNNKNILRTYEAAKFKNEKIEATMIYVSFKNLLSNELLELCQSHLL